MIKLTKELNQGIKLLRPDVRNYLQNVMPFKIKDLRTCEVYEIHKKEISKLCGWDSNPKDCNLNLYDKTISLLIEKLGPNKFA